MNKKLQNFCATTIVSAGAASLAFLAVDALSDFSVTRYVMGQDVTTQDSSPASRDANAALAVAIMNAGWIPPEDRMVWYNALTQGSATTEEGPVLIAQAKEPLSQTDEYDEYNVVLSLQSAMENGTIIYVCEDGACGEEYLPVNSEFTSALLQSVNDGSVVQCNFQRIFTDAEYQDRFRAVGIQNFVKVNYNGLSVADMLRPAQGAFDGAVIERGSCVPYETPLSGSLRNAPTIMTVIGYSAAGGDLDMAAPVTAVQDPFRDRRLSAEYSQALRQNGTPYGMVPDWSGDEKYYKADGRACVNAGDYSIAEKIEKAQREQTTVTVPLRGPCL